MNGTLDANYQFPVELQPIFLAGGKVIEKRKAVVRMDTMKPLGIVSDEYGLVKHGTVVDSLREAGKKYNVQEKISVTNYGANLFYQMTFPKVEMEVKKNDIIRMQMIARNSYNGMNSLRIVFGALRLVCLNGMVIAQKFMQFSYRHIGDVGGMTNGMLIDQYQEAYEGYIKMFNERLPIIQQMSRTKIKGNGLFERKQVHLPTYLLDEANASYQKAGDSSVWGYYNSLTYAISHKMKKESPASSVNYGMIAWKIAEARMN